MTAERERDVAEGGLSPEDCRRCRHHVSFHEHGWPTGRTMGRCWHGRDKRLVVAVDAFNYAEALGLGEDEQRDVASHVTRNVGCSCRVFAGAPK